jgi:hypothetical protein
VSLCAHTLARSNFNRSTDKGNEEWTEGLAAQGIVKQKKAWHPWMAEGGNGIPAGYATSYSVPNSDGPSDFTFITIRLAGHMVCLCPT